MPRQIVLPASVDAVSFRLLNEWQRDFPLVSQPFAWMAQRVGSTEASAI